MEQTGGHAEPEADSTLSEVEDGGGARNSTDGTPRRYLRISLLVVVLGLLLIVGSFVLSGWRLASDLNTLKAEASSAEQAVRDGDVDAAADALEESAAAAASLDSTLTSAPMSWVARAPVVGDSVSAAAVLGAAVNDVLQPLAAGAPTFRSWQADTEGGLAGAASALAEVSPGLIAASNAAQFHEPLVAGIDSGSVVGPGRDAVASAQADFATVSTAVQEAAVASVILPDLLGLSEPTQWLLVPAQPAEARGSGAGFIGAYATVTAEGGQLQLGQATPNDLLFSEAQDLSHLPESFVQLWGKDAEYIWAYNLSRHYPYGAETLQRAVAGTGSPTSYVVSLGPRVVAGLLSLTGPVTAEGVTLSAENAEVYLTNTIYQDFPKGQEKDKVAIALLDALFAELQRSPLDPVDLLNTLAEPVGEQRLQVWSDDEETQQLLADSILAGITPNPVTPVVTVAINNSGGNKMDFYLDSAVTYALTGDCSDDTVMAKVTVELELDQVPQGLPNYITNRLDGRDTASEYGSNADLVHVYAPSGSMLESMTIDGVAVDRVIEGVELGHPVFGALVELPPQTKVTLEATFQQPAMAGQDADVLAQPMIRDTTVSVVDERSCR